MATSLHVRNLFAPYVCAPLVPFPFFGRAAAHHSPISPISTDMHFVSLPHPSFTGPEGKRLAKKAQRLAAMAAPSMLCDRLTWTAAKHGFTFLSKRMREHYTTVTCVSCRAHNKPSGRLYVCHSCGFRGHRDVCAAINIAVLAITQHRLWRFRPLHALLCRLAGPTPEQDAPQSWWFGGPSTGAGSAGNHHVLPTEAQAHAAAASGPGAAVHSDSSPKGTGEGPQEAHLAPFPSVPDAAVSSALRRCSRSGAPNPPVIQQRPSGSE